MQKTYKRETATTLLVFWMGMTVWGVFNEQAATAAQFITVPIFGFAFGAFGFDAWAKQIIPASRAA